MLLLAAPILKRKKPSSAIFRQDPIFALQSQQQLAVARIRGSNLSFDSQRNDFGDSLISITSAHAYDC